MKRLFIVFALVGFTTFCISSCGSKKEEVKEEEADAYDDNEIAEPEAPAATDVIAEGKLLVENGDCKTCHHPTNKIIGPAHTEVAKKYDFTEANVLMIADKIIKGGSGNWGDIMMVPHPTVSQGDAEKMSRYILSLDGETEH